jgi:hypothetical protein
MLLACFRAVSRFVAKNNVRLLSSLLIGILKLIDPGLGQAVNAASADCLLLARYPRIPRVFDSEISRPYMP